MSLFDPSRPLHLLKGDEAGFDFNMFAPFVESITEKRPRLIHVSDLRLLPCKSSATGFALYCTSRPGRSGVENLERIYQVGLELRQDELRSLSAPILRELSRCCFNDLRSIFLVHDKRMLGIVLQELEDLVSVQRIMTVNEADTLRRGIALTIVPGSRTIHALTKMSGIWPGLKDEFVLKPIRSGKGAGILFGDELSYDEWLNHLVELKRPDLGGNISAYVIQRRVPQPLFDLWMDIGTKTRSLYLVGTYMAVNGRYLGIGIWRASPRRVCTLSLGGAWLCSVQPVQS